MVAFLTMLCAAALAGTPTDGAGWLAYIDEVARVDDAHMVLELTVTDNRGEEAQRTIEIWQRGDEQQAAADVDHGLVGGHLELAGAHPERRDQHERQQEHPRVDHQGVLDPAARAAHPPDERPGEGVALRRGGLEALAAPLLLPRSLGAGRRGLLGRAR